MSQQRIAMILVVLLVTAFGASNAHAPIVDHSTSSWNTESRCPGRKYEMGQMVEAHEITQVSVDSGTDSPSFANWKSKHQGSDDLIVSQEEEDRLDKSNERASKSRSKAVEFHIGTRRLKSQSDESKSHNSNSMNAHEEVTALLAFKKAIYDDPLDLMANWTTATSSDHCWAWTGVTCDSQGRVTSINFYASQLKGTITSMLGNLTHLTNLNLTRNNLSGGIPPELGNCNKLSILDVGDNLLTGALPVELGNLSQLVRLNISNNKFSGSIRTGNVCKKLAHLDAQNANLSGAIPSTLGRCRYLSSIRLSYNNLSGPLPRSLGKLHRLGDLSVDYNQLSGKIPESLGKCRSMVILSLSGNMLRGTIPGKLSRMENLVTVVLSNNRFTGIGREFWNMKTLVTLDLSSNSLRGELPQEFGTTPPTLAELVNLKHFNISNNFIGGEIPAAIGTNVTALTSLDMSRNNLSGTIPSTLTHVQSLAVFNVSSNNVHGTIPTSGQFLTFTSASYLPGNDGLCGDVINRSCSQQEATNQSDHNPTQTQSQNLKDHGIVSWSGFEIGAAIGFGSLLLFIVSWRPARNFVCRKSSRIESVQPSHYGLFRPWYA